MKKTALLIVGLFLFLPSLLLAQQRQIRGRITDGTGTGIPDATVNVKGTSTATKTDAAGAFSIAVPDDNAILTVSSTGYVSREIAVKSQTELTLQLNTDVKGLNEVIVVGYGTQKKTDFTGAVSSVSAKTIQERPSNNVLQALQGKAAGMSVSTNNKPGELPSVRIRGNRSLNSTNEPLYVVDGIPLVSSLGVTSFSLNDINPNDILSVEVLKDASATAIYGSRGANGVVLITTRKGAKGRVSVNFNATVTLDSYKSLTDWMDGGEWIDRWREALINGRSYQTTTNTNLNNPSTIGYPDPFLDRSKMTTIGADPIALSNVWAGYEWDQYGVTPKMRATTDAEKALGWPAQVPIYNSRNIKSFDWLDAASRTGLNQNYQVSLSSGNDVSRLYLSLGYNNQLGVQRDQDFERFNLSLSGDISATKWLTLGASMLGSISTQNFGITTNSGNTGSKDLYSRAADQFAFAQPYDDNGVAIKNPGGNLNLWNPLIDIDESINERRTTSALGNIFTEIKFTPWLKYRVNFGAQLRNFRAGAWTGPNATAHLGAKPNTAGYSKDENFSWVIENLLYFDKKFGNDHNLGVTLLQSSQKSRRESISTNVASTIIPIAYWYDLAANTNGRPEGYGTGYTENTLSSYMARANYSFRDKYLLTATGRWDGASVLAPGHKWDFFPSAAIAWKMQDEAFMRNISWVDELKPRVSYGVTGNSSVAPYTASGPLSRNPYVFGSVPAIGYLPQLVQNPDLGWEKTAQLNFGLDFSVLNRRIGGTIEYYIANTSDLLFSRTLPGVSGYVQKWENIAKTRNTGVEITLNTLNIQKKDFSWSTDLNWATNDEEIVELLNGKQDILAARQFIGQPGQVFYHYDNAGIWTNSSKDLAEMAKFNAAPGNHKFFPGTIRVVDQNGDYKIDASDYVIRGTGRPKWTGGMTNTFKYKNWTFISFIYARWGQTYFGGYPNSYGGTNPNGRVENDMWSWNNQSGKWPMPIMGATVDNYAPAMQYNDGSFISVRNLSLSYDLPAKLLKKATMKNCQLNVQVINPFIFGGDIVKMGLNPDDETNWLSESQPNSNSTSPLGGMNNNTIMPQSWVFTIRVGL